MDHFLATHLRAAAEMARAQVGALFAVAAAGRIELSASLNLDEVGLDTARAVWKTQAEALSRGELVHVGDAIVWPLLAGPRLAGLVYLDRAQPGFPSTHDRAHGDVIAARLQAVRRRGAAAAVAAEAPEEGNARLLRVALRQTAGSVAAAARIIGCNRDTVYYWAAKYGIDVNEFRPRR